MDLLLALITAHFICDFYLQPSSWIDDRYKNTLQSKALIKRTFVHGLVNCIVLMAFKLPALHILALTSFITLSHYIIDLWKSYKPQTQRYFLLDQAFHLTIIIIGCIFVSDSYYTLLTEAVSNFLQKKNVTIQLNT